MSDDWGGTVPLPEEDEGASSPQKPTPPSGPKKGRSNVLIGGGLAAVVAVIIIVVLVAGGGGSDDKKTPTVASTSTPAQTGTATETATQDSGKLSKADFITKATQICNSFHDEIENDAQSGDLASEVSAVEQQISQIRDLGAPAEDADTINQALADIDQTTTALRSGDAATATEANNEANSLLDQFGLGACNPTHTG